MADKKRMERLGREYVGELLDLASGGCGYADYVARADVEAVDYGFGDMYVHTVERGDVTLFAGISDMGGRYHVTVVAQDNGTGAQVVVQKNVTH